MDMKIADAEAAAVAVAPRVTLDSMKAKITTEYFFTAGDAVKSMQAPGLPALDCLTICILVLENGFTLIGKSAPASPVNFNLELGRKLAYEDAIRQMWPLEGYALRDRLMRDVTAKAKA